MLWALDEAQEETEECRVRQQMLSPFVWAPEHFGDGQCLSFGHERWRKES